MDNEINCENAFDQRGCTVIMTREDLQTGEIITLPFAETKDCDVAFMMCTQMDWNYFDEDGFIWELEII